MTIPLRRRDISQTPTTKGEPTMAKRTTRRRARLGAQNGRVVRPTTKPGAIAVDATLVPRVLLGAVDGVEIVAAGALHLTRDVLLTAVSGAANIGAEALSATVDGTRGVVFAASRMVGDIAAAAQGTLIEAVNNARHARPGAARLALRRPPVSMAGRSDAATPPDAISIAASRPRAGRRRTTARQAGDTAAA